MREVYGEGRIETTVDDFALYQRQYGGGPLRQEFEQRFGKQGVGWEAVERPPRTPAEKLTTIMGLVVMDVVVTPLGDDYAATRNIEL